MKLLLLFSAFFCPLVLSAQVDTNGVVIHKDPRIDLLISKQIEINEATIRMAKRSGPGFRIMVISTNNRDKAMQAKTTIYKKFPELKAYLMYQAPFFKLKVGDFVERSDAESYLSDIRNLFPSGTYILRDIVEIKPEKWSID